MLFRSNSEEGVATTTNWRSFGEPFKLTKRLASLSRLNFSLTRKKICSGRAGANHPLTQRGALATFSDPTGLGLLLSTPREPDQEIIPFPFFDEEKLAFNRLIG